MKTVWEPEPYEGKTPSVGRFIELINNPTSSIYETLKALGKAMEDMDKK